MPSKPPTIRKLDAPGLLTYALNLLGGRALSSGEVRTRLERRAQSPEDVEPVIAKLRGYGYIDDTKFAQNFAAVRKESGSVGKARIVRDLRQRRVAPALADAAARQAFEGTDEAAMVAQWLERKFRNVPLAEYLKEEKHLASAFGKLRRAGFSSSAAIRVLKQYAARAEELEDEPFEPS